MGRPERHPERGITGSAVEAQAQAMISQPQRVSVTASWKNGAITVQGVIPFRSQQPEPAVLAVTSGTGRFDGAASHSPRTSKS